MRAIAIETWAGVRYYPVEIVGETRTRYRVKVIETAVRLPGNRWADVGQVVLVPKHAVRDVSPRKMEPEPYPAMIYGYGGRVDAK